MSFISEIIQILPDFVIIIVLLLMNQNVLTNSKHNQSICRYFTTTPEVT